MYALNGGRWSSRKHTLPTKWTLSLFKKGTPHFRQKWIFCIFSLVSGGGPFVLCACSERCYQLDCYVIVKIFFRENSIFGLEIHHFLGFPCYILLKFCRPDRYMTVKVNFEEILFWSKLRQKMPFSD